MKTKTLKKLVGAFGLSLAVSGLLFAQSGEFGSQKLKETMQRSMFFLKSIQPATGTCLNSPFRIGSGHLESQIGDIVRIGKKRYMIEAFPFIDYGTGDHYYLKVPVEIVKNGKTSYSMYFDYSTIYVRGGHSCYRYRLSGYPSANNQIFYQEYFNFHKNKFDTGIEEGLSYFNDAFFATSVLVGKTNLSFSLWMEGTPNTVHSKDADYTDDVEWTKLKAKRQLINNIRKWVKYVEIVKMP